MRDDVDTRRAAGEKIGVVSLVSFRPFPRVAVRKALENATTVITLEKAFSVGIGGIVASHIRTALADLGITQYELIAGLGGRDITQASLHDYLDKVKAGEMKYFKFLDLNRELVDRELARENESRRSGSIGDNMIKDITAMVTQEAAR